MRLEPPALLTHRGPAVASSLAIVGAGVLALWAMGRVWWCDCGSWVPWSFNVWSEHNSQHLLDAYTLSHIQHGFVLYGGLLLVFRGSWPMLRMVLALTIEVAWEVIENTEPVIRHYRETTISLEYFGDSILNSLGDIAAFLVGYAAAGLLPVWITAGAYVLMEAVMLMWIRDSLILNVLMLFWPIEAIKQWQMGAMP